jgi:phycocyanobilin lyase beta subunit
MITTERPSLAGLIHAVAQAGSPSELISAVQQLADQRSEEAIPHLVKVLGYNNPSAAEIAMQGLIALGASAVPPLLALMDDYNYTARAYTVRALAHIGDPRAVDCLIHCALHDFAPSVRRAAIKGLGCIVKKSGDRSLDLPIFHTLQTILKDEDWSMRYAAIASLSCFSSHFSASRQLLQSALGAEVDPVVKARLHLALQQISSAT